MCDICHRPADGLLCDTCADTVYRLVVIDERAKTREICEAERLASFNKNGQP